jgi:hypothetical protein
MSRPPAWDGDGQLAECAALRFRERADSVCDAFESLSIRAIE